MPNILTTPIRADREYTGLLDAALKCFHGKSLPILASGLCTGAADALTVCICEDTRESRRTPILIICSEEKECQRLRRDLEQFGHSSAFFVARDLTFHNVTASREFEHERLKVLSGILSGDYDFVLTTPDVALGYTMPPSVLRESVIKIDYDTRTEPSKLAERLVAAGFSRVDMVEGAGQFALRGGIVDVYAPNGEFKGVDKDTRRGAMPLRIEFFDDEIDRMSIFDVETQRSTVNVREAVFTPARELLITAEVRERLEGAIRARFRESKDEKTCETLTREIAALSGELSEVSFVDKYISLVYPERCSLLDYFDEKTLVIVRSTVAVSDRLKAEKWHENEMIKELVAGGTLSPNYAEYSKGEVALEHFFDENVTVHLNSLSGGLGGKRLSGMFGFRTRQPVGYTGNLDLLCEDLVTYQHGGYSVR